MTLIKNRFNQLQYEKKTNDANTKSKCAIKIVFYSLLMISEKARVY